MTRDPFQSTELIEVHVNSYVGRSTGAGGLSIWTHHIKGTEYVDYHDPHYDGPAFKLGAGVQGFEAYAAADKKGLVIVGGECDTVGPVGGYTQGGGHSALSSKFGLAADQTLEWEVVDGRGRLLRASRTENTDLYWALSGGGPSTYGAVYSLTVRVYQDFPVTGVVLNFSSNGIPVDTYYQAVGEFHKYLPTFTAAGGMVIGAISNTSFLMTPLTLPNTTAAEAASLIQPFTNELTRHGILYDTNITTFPNYLQHYMTLIQPNPTQLVENGQYGGHLIPLSVIEENNSGLTAAVRKIAGDGTSFVTIGINVSSSVVGDVYNAAYPPWRTAAMDVILASYVSSSVVLPSSTHP